MLDDAEYTGITQMQKGSAGAAWSTDPAWTTLIDDTGTYTYIGEAPPGSATSSAVWRIARITNATGSTYWAASARFSQIWDNRASLSYS